MSTDYTITRPDQLASILGQPSDLARQKICHELDSAMQEFIQRSPLLFYSTVDPEGLVDVSPKGDAPGFVQVDQDGRLLIPDRPGNRLAYGYRNLLANPSIGLIFLVPTMTETLRIKGTATISNDPLLLERLSARGKPALLCARVEVKECFFHCGKAMIRSHTWKPELWTEYRDSLIAKGLAGKLQSEELTQDKIRDVLDRSYVDGLY